MVNINLLEGKELSSEVDLDMTEIVVSQQEAVGPEEELTEAAPGVEETALEEKPSKEEKETPAFTHRRSSPWPIIAAFAVVLAIVLFVFINPFKSSDTYTETTQQPVSEVPETAEVSEPGVDKPDEELASETPEIETPKEEPVTEAIPVTVSAELDVQRQQNVAGATLLGDFLSAFPSGMSMAFFRYGGQNYLAEIMAPSSALFADFEQKLSSMSPGLLPETLSEEEKQYGGSTVQVRLIQGSIPMTGGTVSAIGSLDPDQIGADLTAKASEKGLEVRQIDISPQVSLNGSTLKPTTVKLSGLQNDVINFIKDILQSYNNVGLDKISISAVSPGGPSDARVSAVLDLDVLF